MLKSLIYQLNDRWFAGVNLEDVPRNDWSEYFRDALEEISRRNESNSPICICIDAVDECADLDEMGELLQFARPLPKGVCLVLSQRGNDRDERLVSAFPYESVHSFVINAERLENVRNVASYFKKRIGHLVSDADCKQLAERTGGVFRIAFCLSEDVLQGKLTPASALELSSEWTGLDANERLKRVHQESWNRITRSVQQTRDEIDALVELLGYLGLLFDWIDEHELLRILQHREEFGAECVGEKQRRSTFRWDDEIVYRRRLSDIGWFIDRRTDHEIQRSQIRLAHSVHGFVWSGSLKNLPPLRKKIHGCIGEFYFKERDNFDAWIDISEYGKNHTVQHLLQAKSALASRWSAELLTSIDFIDARLEARRKG